MNDSDINKLTDEQLLDYVSKDKKLRSRQIALRALGVIDDKRHKGFKMPDVELSPDDLGGSMWLGLDGKIQPYRHTPITAAFHQSRARIKVYESRYMSGKTNSCCVDLFLYMPQYIPVRNGIREMSGAVVRRTFITLQRTVLRSMFQSCPPGFKQTYKGGIRQLITEGMVDGVRHVIVSDLFGLDKDNQQDLLRSYNGAFIYISEYGDVPMWAVDTGRLRQPPYTIIMEGNPPHFGHWIEDFVRPPTEAEYIKYANTGFMLRNSRVSLDDDGTRRYFAELFIGEDGHSKTAATTLAAFGKSPTYYKDLSIVKKKEDHRRFVQGRRAMSKASNPIYSDFSPENHLLDSIPLIPRTNPYSALYFGADADRHGGCIVLQAGPTGQIRVLNEWLPDGKDPQPFAERIAADVKQLYPDYPIARMWGDPSGFSNVSGPEASFFNLMNVIFRRRGFDTVFTPASTNNFHIRSSTVNSWFNKTTTKMRPALVISKETCPRLSAACAHYKWADLPRVEGLHKTTPAKDQHSGIAEALQYALLAVGAADDIKLKEPRKLHNDPFRRKTEVQQLEYSV